MGIQHKNLYKNFSKFFLISFLAILAIAGITGFNALAAQESSSQGSQDKPQAYTVCAQECDFSNIQKAVDKASSGDIIKIKGGKYNEEVKVKKNVTLQAYNDKEEINGGIYFSSPSLTIPNRTTVYVSKIVPAKKNQFPEASKKQNTKKTSNTSHKDSGENKDSTISTPLFDVSIQPKTQDKSNNDTLITLVIFFVIVLTVLGYFVFVYIVHRNKKKDKKGSSSKQKGSGQ